MKKGMLAYIYRHPLGDATNGARSATCNTAIVVGHGMPEIFDAGDDLVLELAERRDGTLFARAAGETRHTMFGGNFVWSSDSRFRRISEGPIQIHDRIEG